MTTGSRAASPPDASQTRRVGPSSPWTSTIIVFVGNVIARALGFAFPLVLSRAVGRPEFALVYFFISTGFFVGEIVLAGYPTSLTRFLAAPANAPRGAWMVSAFVAGAPLLVASIGAGVIFAAQAEADPRLLAVVIIGLSIDAYYFAALRGLGRFGLLVGYRIGANLAQIVLLLLAWWLDVATVPLVVGIYAFTYLIPIAAIELTAGPARRLLAESARAELALVRPLTRFAIPALISGTAYAAIMGLDVYWVRLLAPGELADYSAARALAMPMSLVPFAIGVVLMPRVAATPQADQPRLLRRALGATIWASVAAVAGYVVLGPFLVSLIYPASYAAAAGIVAPLAAAMGVLGMYSVMSQWWMGRGSPGLPAVALIIGAIATAIANVALIPVLGAIGAAFSMMAGSALALLILGGATVYGGLASAAPSDAHVR